MVRKYEAQRPIRAIPAGPKAYPEAMSRQRRAMAGFGGTVMSISLKWQAGRDSFEISRIQSGSNDFHFGLMRQLEDDWLSGKFKDASQFEQAERDYTKAREKNISNSLKGKRGQIADNVRRYTDNTRDQQALEFYRSLYRKEREFRAVEIEKLVQGAIQRGNKNEAEKIISQGEHWLGLGKAKIMRDNLDAQLAETQKQALLDNLHETAKVMAYKDAIQYLNGIKGLKSAERNDLIARRKRQEEIATATTEPKVYWEALREVTNDPDGTTEEYLASLVGKGLTTDDYKEFMGIKESNETVSSNTFWKRESWDYIERQILDVASMTGILYGSSEQYSLAAQAHIAFEKALIEAAKDKPLKGSAILELAHEIMLPFRKRIKPLMLGEKLPEKLVVEEPTPSPINKNTPIIRKGKDGTLIINSMVQPKSVEEFLTVYKLIPDSKARKRYYEKWANEVYK